MRVLSLLSLVFLLAACSGGATVAVEQPQLATEQPQIVTEQPLILLQPAPQEFVDLAESAGLTCEESPAAEELGVHWLCADAEITRQVSVNTAVDDPAQLTDVAVVSTSPVDTGIDQVNADALALFTDYVQLAGGDEAVAWLSSNIQADGETTIGDVTYSITVEDDSFTGPTRTLDITYGG
jgi:hypothetical protein